jgi:hypothetical protein
MDLVVVGLIVVGLIVVVLVVGLIEVVVVILDQSVLSLINESIIIIKSYHITNLLQYLSVCLPCYHHHPYILTM